MNARQRRKVRRYVEREWAGIGPPCPDCDDRDVDSEDQGYFPGPCDTCGDTGFLDTALDWQDVLAHLQEERDTRSLRRRLQHGPLVVEVLDAWVGEVFP